MSHKHPFLYAAVIVGLFLMAASCSDDGDPNGPEPPPDNELIALNGTLFKVDVTTGDFDKAAEFALTDNEGGYIASQQIDVNPIEGDGAVPRSITADGTGIATLTYSFTGQLGYAVLDLIVPDIDTLRITIRANAIVPGVNGQGSYVTFADNFGQAKQWLGEPDQIDVFPSFPGAIYANYEASLGVVLILYDLDNNQTAYDTSSIFGVILTELFDGTSLTTPPVSIGATLSDVRQVFGPPESIQPFDTAGTFTIRYPSIGMILFGDITVDPDTAIVQFTLTEDLPPVPDRIGAPNGTDFVTSMRGIVSNNDLQFTVEDTAGVKIGNAEIQLAQIEGNGTFSGNDGPTLMTTDPSTGIATFIYSFASATVGHSVMRLTIPDVDTLDVRLRSNVLIPGSGGQAQYVLFDDVYADVADFNGNPASIDAAGAFGSEYVYANYHDVLGVTVAFYDGDGDDQLFDTSMVYGVVLDTAYTGTTFDGIGLNSTLADLRGVYGAPDSTVAGAADTVSIYYGTIFARFDAVAATDTTVVRILLGESGL